MNLYDYNLIRSDRRSLSLEITKNLAILVRAPLRCSKRDIDRFLERHTVWIATHINKMRKCVNSQNEPTEEEIIVLKQRAKEILPQRVANYSVIMELVPTGIKITSAKTRFGSCGGKNGLCFSWRLMLYPDAAIDYVVVHELAHIRHKNHGAEFYSLIAAVLPDYKERQKLLKG